MTGKRAQTRSEREAIAAAKAASAKAARDHAAATRARQERRSLAWRRTRLWTHGPSFRRNKERWAALATMLLLVLVLTFLITDSFGSVLVVALVCVIAAPAAAAIVLDRRHR